MNYTLITNLENGAGLQRDFLMLKERLEALGHAVRGEQFNAINPTHRRCDVNIFLEVVTPSHMQYATENWFVPNCEWYFPCWDGLLPRFNKVLCKTQDALNIWQRKTPGRAIFTGWEANDFFNPAIERKREFLHLARNSENKGTEHIIETWRKFPMPYPLTIVARKADVVKYCRGAAGVNLIEELSEAELITKMNACQFHLAPTRYEGFGMWIHEALGVGATVITTDAPPMNTFNGIAITVPVQRSEPRLLARFNHVDHTALATAVHKAWQFDNQQLAEIHSNARAAFLSDREFFRQKIKELAQ